MSMATITPGELDHLCRGGEAIDLIDVRTPVEFGEVHAEPARSVPLDRLDPRAIMGARAGRANRPLYLICRSGARSQQAVERFHRAGYLDVVNVEGGTLAWERAGLPVVRGGPALTLERQVRIAAGGLVVLGVGLGGGGPPRLPRPGGLRRGRPGVRRGHQHLRDGDGPCPDALEPPG